MIRILYLIDNLDTPRAGTERQLIRTIEILDRSRFECTLMTITASPWMEGAQLPCHWETLSLGSLHSPRVFAAYRNFLELCHRRRIQILQTFFSDASIIGPIWGRLARVPIVVGSRRNLGYSYTRRHVCALRVASHFTSHIIANSAAAAQVAATREGFDPARITVIPNLLDMAAFVPETEGLARETKARWGFPEDALVVGAVANLRPVKHLDLLVSAAANLAPRFPQVRFVVIGEGPERMHLTRLISNAGLQEIFALPGLSENVPCDVQAFDIGVLASQSESTPNALLEYMAAGKASVVSRVGGIVETVVDGRTGLIFASGDVAGLTRQLIHLLNERAARIDMGIAAREYVRSMHDQYKVIHALEDLYTNLLERTP